MENNIFYRTIQFNFTFDKRFLRFSENVIEYLLQIHIVCVFDRTYSTGIQKTLRSIHRSHTLYFTFVIAKHITEEKIVFYKTIQFDFSFDERFLKFSNVNTLVHVIEYLLQMRISYAFDCTYSTEIHKIVLSVHQSVQ